MILPLLAAASIFTPKTGEAERQRIVSNFFEPHPKQILEVTDRAVAIKSEQPFTINGEIWVRPPKGQCLIVRRDYGKADKRVCKAMPLEWDIHDLDALGRLSWTVLTDEDWDEGTFVRWQTPYRVATAVPFGDTGTGHHEDIPIRRCSAREVEGERSIVLESFQGKKWTITLPEYDSPVDPEQKELPNLLINLDSKQMTAEEAAKMNEKKKTDTEKSDKPAVSALAQLLTKGYKEEEKQGDMFKVTKRNAYQMESGRFNETGSPRGMTGTCRYKFKDAPGDPESGVVECFGTDSFDSVFALVTCFSQLKARPKSASK